MTFVATDADRAQLSAGPGAGRARPRPGEPEPAGRRGDRPRRRGDRRGLSRRARRRARRGRRDRRLRERAGGGATRARATIYVTLEPCAHHGRQPPCTDAILDAGIARRRDRLRRPEREGAGRGPGILRDEGVEVEFADGAEAAAARLLVQPFRKHARTGRPLVTLKSALSLDGFTATAAATRTGSRAPRAAPSSTAGAPSPTPSRSGSAPRSPTTRCSPPATSTTRRRASRPGSSSTRRRGCRSTRRWSARSTRRRCS